MQNQHRVPRDHLFSFGVVLYEMVTGTLPFGGQTSGEMLEAIFMQQPTAPVRLNPKVPAKLEEVIAKAMEKDRNLRYQHASEMRTDLQRLKRHTSLTSHPSGGRASVPATEAAAAAGRDARPTSKIGKWIDRASCYHCSTNGSNHFLSWTPDKGARVESDSACCCHR